MLKLAKKIRALYIYKNCYLLAIFHETLISNDDLSN